MCERQIWLLPRGAVTGRGAEFSAVWVSAQYLPEANLPHLPMQVSNAEAAPAELARDRSHR